jgi:hypothetical protein
VFLGDNKVTMHKFPNPAQDMERFRSWLYNIGGKLLSMDNDYIYKNGKVCHRHFEVKYCTWTNTLSPNAVPTLFVQSKF